MKSSLPLKDKVKTSIGDSHVIQPLIRMKKNIPSRAATGLIEGLKEIQLDIEGKLGLPDAKEVFNQLI